MEIIETNLTFGSLSNRTDTRRIILHHAEASECSAEDIHRWHKNNGWAGAGYHFLVRKDGGIYRLRPEWALGAHAQGSNYDSLGICFEGAFNSEVMGSEQINAGHELIMYLLNKYGIDTVQCHRDVCATDCPGANFPYTEIMGGDNMAFSNDDANTVWAFNNYGEGGHSCAWVNLIDTNLRVQALQVQLTALVQAVETLASMQGGDPDAVAKAVADAVAAKLEQLKISVAE